MLNCKGSAMESPLSVAMLIWSQSTSALLHVCTYLTRVLLKDCGSLNCSETTFHLNREHTGYGDLATACFVHPVSGTPATLQHICERIDRASLHSPRHATRLLRGTNESWNTDNPEAFHTFRANAHFVVAVGATMSLHGPHPKHHRC